MKEGLAQKACANIETRALNAGLGAEVVGVDLRHMSPAMYEALKAAWLMNIVLVIRDQELSPADLVAFIRSFGTPVSSAKLHKHQARPSAAAELWNLPPEVTAITNLKHNGEALGVLGDGEVQWHSDHSYSERPSAARLLFAREVPPAARGGNTQFLNNYAAFDELPADIKQRIAGKTIKQDNAFSVTMEKRPDPGPSQHPDKHAGPSHPIISTHPETGHNSIFLGRRHGATVDAMESAASEDLLNLLWEHTTAARFQYEHEWRPGDVVLWDNRCTLHRRGAFDPSVRRLLYAVQVEGHRPFEAPDALSLPPHPRYKEPR